MNDKDKEAFGKWWMEGFKGMSDMEVIKYVNVGKQTSLHGWQAACEYKQKEIEELKLEIMQIKGERNKTQFENAKLKEALLNCPILGEVHRDSNDRFKEWNLVYKYILKELEK